MKKAIQINPNYVEAHNNLGTVFTQLGEHQKAISCYEKAIQIQPNHVNAHNNLGAVFKQLGEHKKAISYFQKTNSVASKEELLRYSYLLDGLEDYKKKTRKICRGRNL